MHTFLLYLPALVMLACCGTALTIGSATERQGATIYFVAWIGCALVLSDHPIGAALDAFTAIDVVVFASFVLLAWKSKRTWPICAAAFQAVELLADTARYLGVSVKATAPIYAGNVAAYGILATMVAGAWLSWREREALRSFGINAQAETSSPASARSIRSSVRPTPKMATKDPNRGPWF
jgi:hypothetical protein